MQAAEAAIVIFLFINSINDIKRREIILWSAVFMGVFGFIVSVLLFKRNICEIAFGIVPGVLLLICAIISDGKLGLGDVIIMIVVGIWQGLIRTVYIVFAALFGAALYGTFLIIINKKYRDIPFIPFICMGQLITWLV